MKTKSIFKIGDKVYHYEYGKGEVVETKYANSFPLLVKFGSDYYVPFTSDGREFYGKVKTLSFTEYNLIDGGFSQERPMSNIKVDTLIYVRMLGGTWQMNYFSHFKKFGVENNINVPFCFADQKKSTETSKTVNWSEWSLTNPVENKEDEK